MPKPRRFVAWLALSLLVIVLDRWSKSAILAHFVDYERVTYTSFFNLHLMHNPGAAFGLLDDAGGWQVIFFSVLALAAAGLILWQLWLHADRFRYSLALAWIMGGALGNAYDRVTRGQVVDFLEFHWGPHFWPAFNIADCAIVGGAGLLILDSFLHKPAKAQGASS
ncbi:signal peptidase II [Leeia sp.]|uniref:signal peptidase II n=1 Tax=Leeia sp. TaxID=2884678 RepID=UPI0035ADAE4A